MKSRSYRMLDDAYRQLLRYSGEPYKGISEVVKALAQVNDDLAHMRPPEMWRVRDAVRELEKICEEAPR